jgi:signal transduction histidine kinase
MDPDVMARLAAHRAVGSAPPEEHAWLAARGELRGYPVGAVVTPAHEQATELLIYFTGRVVIRGDRGAGSFKIFEWRGGDVGGALPYSRRAVPPADAVAEEPTEVLAVDRALLDELTRDCPAVTATLVHAMVDRARHFTSADLRDEKLLSLGKLAAGLAHELNNPASAVMRSAKTLTEGLGSAEAAARELIAAGLSPEQYAAVESARTACSVSHAGPPLSAVEHAEHEEDLADWLARHGVGEEWAAALAETGVTRETLGALSRSVSGEALVAALRWLSACCLVRALAAEIEGAATRIHDLVAAVKGFSFMDHAPKPEPVDIRRGMADTLQVLGSKTRAKAVTVSMQLPDDLPCVRAVGAELNQVWMNLIDNAIDAVAVGGRVTIAAGQELDRVVVRIIDDGPGIPPEIRGRIFDPFFTTKPVGEGSGLGLDVVRRLLQREDGEVAVDSVPGRTEFQVRLRAER